MIKTQPVNDVRWIPLEQIRANDYNPNTVAKTEMRLLYISIKHDGYTQPVVVIKKHKYVVRIFDFVLCLEEPEHKGELWNYLSNLAKQQSLTQQPLLMPMEVSISIGKLIDTQLEFSNQKKTEEKTFLNGLSMNGDLVTYTFTEKAIPIKDSQQCIAGLSQDWKNVTKWHVLSININSSKDINQNKSSNIINIFLPPDSITGNGMLLRMITSEKIGEKKLTEKYPKLLDAVSMQSEREETYLDLNVSDDSEYVIIDGFHRYHVMKTHQDIYDACEGRLPCVVLDKLINDRMASTVRHNRARGKHSVTGMSQMVFNMLENGWKDADICNELGMEPEELLRLKHITGFSALYQKRKYGPAWVSPTQVFLRKKYEEHPEMSASQLNAEIAKEK